MKTKLFDISGKIDKFRLEIIISLKEACDSLSIPFFIVGATAKDIILEYIYNIKTYRATNDIDFGIYIEDWNAFDSLISALLKNGKYSVKDKIEHRLFYDKAWPLDIIPFGKIASDAGTIRWPKDKKVFTVLGFREAYENSNKLIVQNNPYIAVNFASPESLCLLKIISWWESYPGRSRDASDIAYMAESYLDAGNRDRLAGEESYLVDDEFDYTFTGARLLGRDIAEIFEKNTLDHVLKILHKETGEQVRYLLVEDMLHNIVIRGEKDFNYFLYLLENLKSGIMEGIKNKTLFSNK